METGSWLLSCWFFLYCLVTAAGDLSLTTSTEEISLGLTDSLTVNCTFTNDDNSQITALITFFIFRKKDNSTPDEELASINSYINHVNTILPEFNSSSGRISNDGVSYLELTWLYPTERQRGIYICTARGIDDVGHTLVIEKQATVTSRLPERDEILGRIKEINENLKNVDQKFSDLYSNLSGNFYQFTISQSKHDDDVNKTLAVLGAFEKEVHPLVGLYEQSLFYPFNLTYGRNIYRILRAPVWGGDDAVALCESYGARLLEIDTIEEYTTVKTFLTDHPRLAAISMGGRHVNNQWVKQYSNTPILDLIHLSTPSTVSDTHDCLILSKITDWDMEPVSCKEIQLIPPYKQVNAMCEWEA